MIDFRQHVCSLRELPKIIKRQGRMHLEGHYALLATDHSNGLVNESFAPTADTHELAVDKIYPITSRILSGARPEGPY